MDSVTIFVLSLCIVYSQAFTLTDLYNDFKEIKNEVQDLKEHVKQLETLTGVLTRGHIRRQNPSHPNIAFDAMLSHDYVHGDQQAVLKFDNVLTNVGNAYNPSTGIFTAPTDGTYLFNWSIRTGYLASIVTKLMVNGKMVQATHTDSSLDQANQFDAHSSKTAILTLIEGDRVYIENYPQRGTIHSDDNGQSGFVGTLLFN